jgi:3',5'-cyclic AMP phosphodiesterase CpdA
MCAHVRCAVCVGWLVALSHLGSARAQSSAFESGPYLSQLGSRSVVVRVETENPERLTLSVEPGKSSVSDGAALAGVHSLEVGHLLPKTSYRYTVKSDRGASENGSFTTAPEGDDNGTAKLVLYGDDRGNPGVHQSIVKRILDEPADFLVNTGDLVADGRVSRQWKNFFDIEDKLLRDHCLFAAIGNHDLVEESGATFLKYFGSADEQEKHLFYTTFRWGFMRFFMLNGEGPFVGDDRAWLERELAKADTEPNLAWRIVVIHDGPFASGLHGDNEHVQAAGVPKLLHDHHIDFVLQGHDHIYERGVSDGMRYIVSGGAGAPLYPMKHLRATARKVESSYHYVLLEVGRERGKLTAKRVDGSVIEEVGFSKSSFWDDDLPGASGISAPSDAAPPAATPGPDSAPDERKQSSNEVPIAVAGVALIGAAWFWVSRRRKR